MIYRCFLGTLKFCYLLFDGVKLTDQIALIPYQPNTQPVGPFGLSIVRRPRN